MITTDEYVKKYMVLQHGTNSHRYFEAHEGNLSSTAFQRPKMVGKGYRNKVLNNTCLYCSTLSIFKHNIFGSAELLDSVTNEPRHEKTYFLDSQKQW